MCCSEQVLVPYTPASTSAAAPLYGPAPTDRNSLMASLVGLLASEFDVPKTTEARPQLIAAALASTPTLSGRAPDDSAAQERHGATLHFSGSLGELVTLCRTVSSGTTVDLGRACIEESDAPNTVRAVLRRHRSGGAQATVGC